MVVTVFGILISSRLVQFENAKLPIFITISGRWTSASFLQSKNALSLMVCMPFGNTTLLRLLQKAKAAFSIILTLSGIVTAVMLSHS